MDIKRKVAAAGSKVGSSVGLALNLGHKTYSADDDLLSQFAKDIKTTESALNFYLAQCGRVASTYWPHVFKAATKAALLLVELMGEDALHFDDIQKYYNQFDLLQAHSESFKVHPKERQLAVPSIQHELAHFHAMLVLLEERVVSEAQRHAQVTKAKVQAIAPQLKHIRKILAKRDTQRGELAKIEKKIANLSRKASLDPKAHQDLDDLEFKQKVLSAAFNATNSRLKMVLPEQLLLIEEFVDALTKWNLCHHAQTLEEVFRTFEYFSVFHGFTSGLEDGKLTQTYDAIKDQWEAQATKARLQVESMFLVIYSKNPDLIDKEVDAGDSRLRATQAWSHMTEKAREKTHKVKAKDLQNGVFGDYMIADPLRSYLRYQDPALNKADTYLEKLIDYSDVHIVTPARVSPPPLPPRDDSHRILLLSPNPQHSHLSSPMSPDVCSTQEFGTTPLSSLRHNASSDSVSSLQSEISLSSAEAESATTQSLELSNFSLQRSERELIKLYNSAKNDIVEAPVLPSKYADLEHLHLDIFASPNSISYKLNELNSFFSKALSHSEHSEKVFLTAKKGFEGIEPGDLSFEAGETVEVIFDLQLVSTSYSSDGRNWFVGAVGEHRRVGFAPSTYF